MLVRLLRHWLLHHRLLHHGLLHHWLRLHHGLLHHGLLHHGLLHHGLMHHWLLLHHRLLRHCLYAKHSCMSQLLLVATHETTHCRWCGHSSYWTTIHAGKCSGTKANYIRQQLFSTWWGGDRYHLWYRLGLALLLHKLHEQIAHVLLYLFLFQVIPELSFRAATRFWCVLTALQKCLVHLFDLLQQHLHFFWSTVGFHRN